MHALFWQSLKSEPADEPRAELKPVLNLIQNQSWFLNFYFFISSFGSTPWISIPPSHFTETFQRGLREGSLRVQWGLSLPTLNEPSMNPQRTPNEQWTDTERIQRMHFWKKKAISDNFHSNRKILGSFPRSNYDGFDKKFIYVGK